MSGGPADTFHNINMSIRFIQSNHTLIIDQLYFTYIYSNGATFRWRITLFGYLISLLELFLNVLSRVLLKTRAEIKFAVSASRPWAVSGSFSKEAATPWIILLFCPRIFKCCVKCLFYGKVLFCRKGLEELQSQNGQ